MNELLANAKSVVIVLALVTLWTMESLIPLVHGKYRRSLNLNYSRLLHNQRNLSLAVINGVMGLVVTVLLLNSLFIWSEQQSFGLIHWIQHYFKIGSAVQFVLLLLLFDIWQYGWHRLNHRVAFLWRFHSVHHSDREMDVSTALRFHVGEISLSLAARVAVIPLLGMQLQHLLLYELIALPVILFHHSNIRLKPNVDRLLIVTPAMHWGHHSDEPIETDTNYGSVLSIWDRLFGSFRLSEDIRKLTIGLKKINEEQ